jgi:hypothetical protein
MYPFFKQLIVEQLCVLQSRGPLALAATLATKMCWQPADWQDRTSAPVVAISYCLATNVLFYSLFYHYMPAQYTWTERTTLKAFTMNAKLFSFARV